MFSIGMKVLLLQEIMLTFFRMLVLATLCRIVVLKQNYQIPAEMPSVSYIEDCISKYPNYFVAYPYISI